MDCLKNGIFARTTLKPLSSVFNLEKEKNSIKTLVKNGEWFSVSGLRRTGKTTLVRSVINTLDVYPIYINLWRQKSELIDIELILEEIAKQLKEIIQRRKLQHLLSLIEKISFMGVSIKVKVESQTRLIEVIKELTKEKIVVLIFDEAEELKQDPTTFRYLASLHDELAPKLAAVFLGSVVSMKRLLNSSISTPLYGRLGEEIVLEPFNESNSRKLLREGFKECNVDIDEDLIIEASLRLGGFAGWLTSFGRHVVLEYRKGNKKPEFNKILNELEADASKIVYDEIARVLTGRKRVNAYLRVLKYAAENGVITVAETSRILRKVPSTAITYLKQLVDFGIMSKENSEYMIKDPLVRRIAMKPNFEKEVKIRL
ncbi:MAG: AAA family ATPase [Candidatus Asgardarchaeia archaeon]